MTGPVKLPASSGSPMRSRFAAGDELLGEAVEELLGDEDAARRDAALAAGLEGADEAAVDRQIEPGVLADDDGALAAHLAGDDAIVMLGRQLLDALADVVAAGEQDDVDVGIAHQRLAGLAVAVDQVDDARRESRPPRTVRPAAGRWPACPPTA